MANEGKKFEQDFMNSVPKHFWCYRLRDSAGTWQGGKNTRFTPSNICDFILMGSKELYLLELKSVKGTSLPFANIRKNQIEELSKIQHPKVNGMFVINFRKKEETYLVQASKIKKFVEKADRKSIPISWCKKNGMLVPGYKKISRYRYDIADIFN